MPANHTFEQPFMPETIKPPLFAIALPCSKNE